MPNIVGVIPMIFMQIFYLGNAFWIMTMGIWIASWISFHTPFRISNIFGGAFIDIQNNIFLLVASLFIFKELLCPTIAADSVNLCLHRFFLKKYCNALYNSYFKVIHEMKENFFCNNILLWVCDNWGSLLNWQVALSTGLRANQTRLTVL